MTFFRLLAPAIVPLLLVLNPCAFADEPDAKTKPNTTPPIVVKLWPNGAPGALGQAPEDQPELSVYLPKAKNTKIPVSAVVVCPGGGYGGHAAHEAEPIARWLQSIGIAGCVLKYRLGPKYHHPVMLQDAGRAIRLVRDQAETWGIDPKHVGILGFSAGGHLASTAGTHFDKGQAQAADPVDRQSSRPDAMILIYPVIAMNTPYAHGGSVRNLLGDHPNPKDLVSLSNETQVTPNTPPTFLVHSFEDKPVPVENSMLFAKALREANVPFEFHLYEAGAHGYGLGQSDPARKLWPEMCRHWLARHGF